ncbi:MAG: hypothetical protein ACR2QA_19170 [Solirubrobacteraceae bacterium]
MTDLVIIMDESGNTGENLLDANQPIYVLAAVRHDLPGLEAAVADAQARAGFAELKFSALRAAPEGRDIATCLLSGLPLAEGAAIIVADKPWMLAAKLVDELIEPTMLARGHQMAWIQSGLARDTAELLAHLGRRELGDTYDDLAQTFVALVRRYTPNRSQEFQRALRRCKIVCRNHALELVLADMISTNDALEDAFASRTAALDPGLTALFTQAGYWSSRLAVPFEVRHDESTTVRGWATLFAEMRASRLALRGGFRPPAPRHGAARRGPARRARASAADHVRRVRA